MYLSRILPVFLFVSLLVSCRKDEQFLKSEGTLNFSKDTIYFDTVFTRLPGSNYPRSINKQFMIRNPYKESVKVNVRLMAGSITSYRINVDGRSGRNIPEVEILPEDSAWVFVEATLEPNNLTNPALVRDSIEFETNGNRQYVQLAAYGWDAYYFKDTVFTGTTSLVLYDKPYVIVNTAFVDAGATLNIGQGIHFYCTPNSTVLSGNKTINVAALNVFGTLKINGSKDRPVVFEGDRLGLEFTEKAGQWRGLHFWRGSVNNEITHALIKNATIGIQVDSLPESGPYSLMIRNTRIRNISAYGILGLTAKMYVENTAVSNCGLNTFIGYYGGDYTLIHCSLYTGANGRRDPHVLFNNALRDNNNALIRSYNLSYAIVNSILWGPLKTEIGFDLVPPPDPPLTAVFNYNIYQSETNLGGIANKRNTDPKFIDAGNSNLKLKSDSPAKDAADPANAPSGDLEDKPRDASPDMGAYEI